MISHIRKPDYLDPTGIPWVKTFQGWFRAERQEDHVIPVKRPAQVLADTPDSFSNSHPIIVKHSSLTPIANYGEWRTDECRDRLLTVKLSKKRTEK